MKNPSLVRVTGPFTEHAPGFLAELVGAGYGPGSATSQLELLADASRWLASEGLGPEAFSPGQVERFLEARRAAGCARFVSQRAFVFRSPLLGYLRGLGVVPSGEEPASSPVEALLECYRVYLLGERGLAPGTVVNYVAMARPFLEGRLDSGGQLNLVDLTAGEVLAFVLSECKRRRRRSAQLMVAALAASLPARAGTDRRAARAGGAFGPGLAAGRTAAGARARAGGEAAFKLRSGHGGRAPQLRGDPDARAVGHAPLRGRGALSRRHRLARWCQRSRKFPRCDHGNSPLG
jgi:hypothetical protein